MMHEVVFLNERNVRPIELEVCSDNAWFLDNGTSNHMTGNKAWFCKLNELVTRKIRFGDDSRIDIKGKGSILFMSKGGERRILADVYYIPELRSNIICLGQATKAGCDVRMKENYLTLHDRDGNLLVNAIHSRNRLYKVDLEVDNTKYLQLEVTSDSSRWHARVGHVNFETIKAMVVKELVVGKPSAPKEKEICSSCLLGKQARQSFPKNTSYRASRPLELIHGDLCGPISPSTAAKKRYIFVLIDDHSCYMLSILLTEKSETFEKFKRFKALVEQETGTNIKTFRTNKGGEFVSQELQSFCEKQGINRHFTVPYTPQQNRVVERCNKTLLEMTRSILKHISMPNYLWENVEYLRVFGCVCYAKIEAPHLCKLDGRSKMLVYLGTEPGSKAYRLLDPTNRKVIVNRDVIFDENKSWKWNNSKSESRNESGTFTLSLGEFENHGFGEKEIATETE